MLVYHDDRDQRIAVLEAENARLRHNSYLKMLNSAGLLHAIDHLPVARYVLVLCDVDQMKQVNSATGSHDQTDRHLARGLKVRDNELAGQLRGDEIVFILEEATNAPAFIARIGAQLRRQRLDPAARRALLLATGRAHITVTAAWRAGVLPCEMRAVLDELSVEVLALKAARDAVGPRC